MIIMNTDINFIAHNSHYEEANCSAIAAVARGNSACSHYMLTHK